jgi:predicted nucleic acid-binding protein
LWVGPWVLRELDGVLNRKSPRSKPYLALLLDRAWVQVGPEALVLARTVVDYLPDAQILAEAMEAGASYLVSLDRTHLVGVPQVARLPFPVGTPGDFLAWYRAQLTSR